jgi:hypothetical protein
MFKSKFRGPRADMGEPPFCGFLKSLNDPPEINGADKAIGLIRVDVEPV